MQICRTKAAQSGTVLKTVARGIYETVKSGAWKKWHVILNSSTKVGGDKSGGYTIAYATKTDFQQNS